MQPAGPPSFELLEPRLLLSADLIEPVPLSPLDAPLGECAIYADLNHEDDGAQESSSSGILTYGAPSDVVTQPAEAECGPAETPLGSPLNRVESTAEVDAESGALAPVVRNEDIRLSASGQQDDPSDLQSLSIQIRGPPDLPGMHLVDPDPANLAGQIIYLDFDGEQNVIYDGPVTVEAFDVPAFQAPGELAGQERAIIELILAQVEGLYAGSGVIFTTEQPQGPQPYSTIYIGGGDFVFADYGRFLGLAERVDSGNLNRSDNALVFSDQVIWQIGCEDVAIRLADTIAHEVGHLLGYRHEEPVATSGGTLDEVSLSIELSLGTPVTGTLEGTGDGDIYYVEMAAGQYLAVQLDGDSAGESYDFNELYIRYGQPPTETEYDAAGKEPYQPDQYAEILNTQAGTYYILVRCSWDASPLDSYTLQARLPGIDRVDMTREVDYEAPGIAADDAYLYQVEVTGAGITGIDVTTPWGYEVDLEDLLPSGWRITDWIGADRGPLYAQIEINDEGVPVFSFEWYVTPAQWTSLNSGQTTLAVTWAGGTWNAPLDFGLVPQSIQEPYVTSPVSRSMEGDNVTVQWAAWSSPPPAGRIYIEMDNMQGGGSLHGELPASATSWTLPAPLGGGAFYECDVEFNTHADSTVGGVPVTAWSLAESDVPLIVGMPVTTRRVHPDTGHTYFLTAPGTWWQAQVVATGFGGNLVTINDAQEEAWLQGQYGFNESFWIGFTDSGQEGTWEWVSGEPVAYENWAPGEPNDYFGDEDAAQMNWQVGSEYKWNDAPVDWWARGIVELPSGTVPELADDHGNTFGDATEITVPTSLAGELDYFGDLDFFSFNAVAGTTYDIRVDLPESGLDDSTLWLYGTDGRTLLAWDDDGGYGSGSRLVWIAPASGTYYLAVDSCELFDFGGYTLQVAEIGLLADTPLAWFDHPAMWLDLQGDWGVATSKPYYTGATSDDNEMLHSLNMSSPLSPIDLGQYIPGTAEGRTTLANPQRFYLSDDGPRDSLGHPELVVLDMGVSGDPVETCRIPIAGINADAVAVDGNYLYVGTQIDEIGNNVYLEVYDISNPDAPVFVGQSQPIASPPGDLFDHDLLLVADGRIYMLHAGASVVSILDVHNPAAPELLGQYTLSSDPSAQAEYMAVAGSVLWVAVGWELYAIDVSDAASPVQLSVLPLDGRIHQVIIDGSWAYVGTAGMGANVVDILDPSDPVVVDSYTVPGAVGTLAVNNGHLYVPTGARRIAIFEIPPAPALPDLLVTHISIPAAVASGDILPIIWIVQNRSTTATTAVSWTDAVFLSTDPVPSPDELVATLEHAGGLAGRGVYTASLDLDTTAIAEGAYYVIIMTDYGYAVAEQREGNNTTVSQGSASTGITQLTTGTPVSGTFLTSGEAHYYVVTVGEGDHLQVVLDDANDIGHNELYICYGQPPTRSEYDLRYATNLAADQTVEVPDAQAGDYYILVYAESSPDAPTAFTLTASILDFCIASFTPETGGNAGQVTMQIKGAKFTEGMTPSLISPTGVVIEPTQAAVTSVTEIWATFDLTGAEAGLYDVRVDDPVGPYDLQSDAFVVEEGGGPQLETEIVIPSAIRAGREGTFYVEVTNAGLNDVYTPVIWVVLPDGMLASLDPQGELQDVDELLLDVQPPECPFSVIARGTTISVPVHYRAPGAGGSIQVQLQIFGGIGEASGDIRVYHYSESDSDELLWPGPLNPKWRFYVEGSAESINAPTAWFYFELLEEYPPPDWHYPDTDAGLATPTEGNTTFHTIAEYVKVGAQLTISPSLSSTWIQIARDYVTPESSDACITNVPFEGVDSPLPADDLPFYDEGGIPQPFFDQPGMSAPQWATAARYGLPMGEWRVCFYHFDAETHPVFWDGAHSEGDEETVHIGNQGVVWRYDLTAMVKEDGRDGTWITVVRAVDPNSKTGGAGFGDGHYIAPVSTIPFTTYYENDPAAGANAPAQVLKIEDTLEADLDLTTFELGDINLYGDYWIDVPDGLQYYETILDLRPEGNNLLVHVTAGLDSGSRTVTWLFTSLDPDTLALPDDPMAGFLPVNDKAIHNGEGHVTYTIRPIASLPTGTEITNQALITFDVNDPIATPTTLNTIDAGLPSSYVLPFASDVTTSPSIPVEWTGQDDAGGSGIASYDIYVSTDGGGYMLWQDDIAETSATFPGEAGHVYSFYSVARDNVGHQEQSPETPDATIRVLSPVYRFWSPVYSRHFYTISERERDKLINTYSRVWTYEGVAYYAFADDTEPGVAPIYRFWSGTLRAHFYTMSESERDKLVNDYSHVWTYEGIAFYAYPEGPQPINTCPVYRFWSGTLRSHFYTLSQRERDKLINLYSHVWTYELIAWYACE